MEPDKEWSWYYSGIDITMLEALCNARGLAMSDALPELVQGFGFSDFPVGGFGRGMCLGV